jgi:hypothetical protein
MKQEFIKFFEDNYSQIKGIPLGRPSFNGEVLNEYEVNIPISTLTRHGLITGSTGTGKSRVIQLMIESLVNQGIPVFLSDIKGDMSGFSIPGNPEKVAARATTLNYNFSANKFPANYWGTAEGLIHFRINLADTDYIILAKLLELNPTQESHLGTIYKYARDKNLKLTNLKSLNELILYLIKYPEKAIGSSVSSLSVISRKISNLEFCNLDKFFGEPALDINNFLTGGVINILWLQNFLKENYNAGNIVSFLINKLYRDLPEVGGTVKPKLVIFIDEAHRLFDNANPKLIELIVSILKQIRSKGVGIIFNTQNADDIPEKILEQLGLKIQFALRAFSVKELQQIRGVVESFPESKFYNLKEEVKSLESGTAFVSILNENGALLSPVKTVIYPPASFMDAVAFEEIAKFSDQNLKNFYGQIVDSSGKKVDADGNLNTLNLGSPLDNITVSRGGNWQMKTFFQRKEDQAVTRVVNKRNREIRKFMILILAILVASALLFFLYLVYTLINKQG